MRQLQGRLDIYCIHFSQLSERKKKLSLSIPSELEINWVTERSIPNYQIQFKNSEDVLGISPRKIGMDLGINSRSLSRTRRRAKYEGYILYLRSFIDRRGSWLVASQIENREPQKKAILENFMQHLHAIDRAAKSNKPFHLILEDDALPGSDSWSQLEILILNLNQRGKFVAFLGSGAGLKRTKSDKRIDSFGLYNTGTYGTRTAVATLYSRDVCIEIMRLVETYGVPNWMPIDFFLQVGMRKLKIKTYWQDPPFFEQGSENGTFKSSLR